jgi:hypothetical protein
VNGTHAVTRICAGRNEIGGTAIESAFVKVNRRARRRDPHVRFVTVRAESHQERKAGGRGLEAVARMRT